MGKVEYEYEGCLSARMFKDWTSLKEWCNQQKKVDNGVRIKRIILVQKGP